MKKGDYLDIKGITSIINGTELKGLYQFDSYEKLDGKETCYVTKRIGNGMCYLVGSEEVSQFVIAEEDLPNYGIIRKRKTSI